MNEQPVKSKSLKEYAEAMTQSVRTTMQVMQAQMDTFMEKFEDTAGQVTQMKNSLISLDKMLTNDFQMMA